MTTYVLRLQEIDRSKAPLVGGKGANLGELYRIKNILVPDSFCVSTDAYREVTLNNQTTYSLLNELATLKLEERSRISETSAKLRAAIVSTPIPSNVADEILSQLAHFAEDEAFAVRSSATAEDLPAASFAGQQDTYLNVIGKQAILKQISQCWASLFSERAVIYRLQNGFDHRKVYLAVVVQKMVFPQVAGVLFTADPITSNRKVLSVDASFGLGEAIVSGRVNADNYKIYGGKSVSKTTSTKKLASYASKDGGTREQVIEPEQQNRQALTDEQILRLEGMARTIEGHFGRPQDIEWCLVDDTFYFVQTRPITALYPIPEVTDQENHVYVSVGHQQMMTDAMKPLGLSFFLLTTRAPMRTAGGRLFVDVTAMLASPVSRKRVIDALGQSDPLIKDALTTIIERADFVQALPADDIAPRHGAALADTPTDFDNNPAIVSDLIKRSEASRETLQHNIRDKAGAELFDFIVADIQELRSTLFGPSLEPIKAAMAASTWLNEHMNQWLGEANVADTLSQSVPNNITSEMGLALLDVADVIRPYPDVIEHLRHANDADLRAGLLALHGGAETDSAISAYLAKYGMRCSGEIDISKPRWSERPSAIVPMILTNIKNFEPGASRRKFEQGRQEALNKERELLDRLRQLPDGERKAAETKRMISLMRNFIGYREYPKYSMVCRYFVYKQALLTEAEKLVKANLIPEKEDIYYLTFDELREAVCSGKLDYDSISKRKDEYKNYEKLTPPRVLTSDGEIVAGAYKRENVPVGALLGLPVSSGVIEGRARVCLNIEDAELEAGDILVTAFTDPSWTPLFVSAKGLVTEVGGLMTHGAVVAREYGLPAVVGVENATRLIRDGQRIRVNGTHGYLELL